MATIFRIVVAFSFLFIFRLLGKAKNQADQERERLSNMLGRALAQNGKARELMYRKNEGSSLYLIESVYDREPEKFIIGLSGTKNFKVHYSPSKREGVFPYDHIVIDMLAYEHFEDGVSCTNWVGVATTVVIWEFSGQPMETVKTKAPYMLTDHEKMVMRQDWVDDYVDHDECVPW